MPGVPPNFAALSDRAKSSFNYLLRRSGEQGTRQARFRQENITGDQLVEMRNLLMGLHTVWQPFKDLPENNVNRQQIFKIIDFCYDCFCYAWLEKPANQETYYSGMQQMQEAFSPVLDDALQRYYPALFPPAAPVQQVSPSSYEACSMSCDR